MKKLTAFLLRFTLLAFLITSFSNTPETGYLTRDGAWCWFSDPRAVFDGNQVITGWVKSNGSVEAAAFDLLSGNIQTQILYPELQSDDHNNPAFAKTADGRLLAAYTTHSGSDGFFINKTQNGRDISSFGEAVKVPLLDSAELRKSPKRNITLPTAEYSHASSSADAPPCFPAWRRRGSTCGGLPPGR